MAILTARSVDELNTTLGASRKQVEALVVPDEGLFIANSRLVAALVNKGRLPAIGFRDLCEAGALLAYGVDFPYIWRESATLVTRSCGERGPASFPSSKPRDSS